MNHTIDFIAKYPQFITAPMTYPLRANVIFYNCETSDTLEILPIPGKTTNDLGIEIISIQSNTFKLSDYFTLNYTGACLPDRVVIQEPSGNNHT